MTTCPCCGGRIEGPPPISTLNHLPFTPLQKRVLAALVDAYPQRMTMPLLVEAVYPNDRPATAEQAIRTSLASIRPKLYGTGWRLPRSAGGPGAFSFYWLERAE